MLKKFLGILILFLPVGLLSCGSQSQVRNSYVVSVHDGDTLTLSDGHVIRLFGTDTPEMNNQYNEFSETSGIERIYAEKATQFAKHLVEHKNVVVTHISSDQYGREVAKIEVNGQDLGLSLIGAGMARMAYISITPKDKFFTSDYNYYQELLKAQWSAFNSHLGFWNENGQFNIIFPKA